VQQGEEEGGREKLRRGLARAPKSKGGGPIVVAGLGTGEGCFRLEVAGEQCECENSLNSVVGTRIFHYPSHLNPPTGLYPPPKPRPIFHSSSHSSINITALKIQSSSLAALCTVLKRVQITFRFLFLCRSFARKAVQSLNLHPALPPRNPSRQRVLGDAGLVQHVAVALPAHPRIVKFEARRKLSCIASFPGIPSPSS
jgi:hypothetical protein